MFKNLNKKPHLHWKNLGCYYVLVRFLTRVPVAIEVSVQSALCDHWLIVKMTKPSVVVLLVQHVLAFYDTMKEVEYMNFISCLLIRNIPYTFVNSHSSTN